jgi:hypothetical protein
MLLVLLKVIFTKKGGEKIMEQLILIMLNAGDEAIQAGIKTGLDIAYAYFKKQVEESRTPIDDKVLQIIVNAIHDWSPKN